MNASHNAPQATSTTEDAARDTADNLLMDAFDSIPLIVPRREIGQAEATLEAAHAIVAKLDAMESSHLKAMREIRESINFLSKTLLGL